MNSDLERVYNVCTYVRDSNTKVSFKKLISATRVAFNNSSLYLVIKTKKDKTFEPAQFSIEAYYDAEDDFNGEPPIEVIISHNFTDSDIFDYCQIGVVLQEIFDAVVHELRHQRQSVARNYQVFSNHDKSPFDQYLSDPDEIDAYALSVAIELLRAMPKERIERYMKRVSTLAKMKRNNLLVSPNLKAYIDHFGLNWLTKRFIKKVYKHLERLDNSFIFK